MVSRSEVLDSGKRSDHGPVALTIVRAVVAKSQPASASRSSQVQPPSDGVGRGELDVVGERRPVAGGGAERVDDQPGVVGEGVEVAHRAGEPRPRQAGEPRKRLGDAEGCRIAEVVEPAQHVVHADAERHFPPAEGRALARGEQKRQRLGEVGGDAGDDRLLFAGLAHQADAALGEIADAAVEQAAGAAARAGGEVVLLDQRGSESAHGRVAGNAGADDAAADHEHVEPARGEAIDCRGAGLVRRLLTGDKGHRRRLHGKGTAGQS